MKRLNLTKTVTIRAAFSWLDWELYELPGAVEAARRLNEELTLSVNVGDDRKTVRFNVELVMQRFSNLGATDTEPRAFLEQVLDEIFGDAE